MEKEKVYRRKNGKKPRKPGSGRKPGSKNKPKIIETINEASNETSNEINENDFIKIDEYKNENEVKENEVNNEAANNEAANNEAANNEAANNEAANNEAANINVNNDLVKIKLDKKNLILAEIFIDSILQKILNTIGFSIELEPMSETDLEIWEQLAPDYEIKKSWGNFFKFYLIAKAKN